SWLLLYIRDSDNCEFKIWLAGAVHARTLSAIGFIVIAVFYVPDNLVTLSRLHAFAVKKDRVHWTGVARLVGTVVAPGNKYFVGDMVGRDVARTVHVKLRRGVRHSIT